MALDNDYIAAVDNTPFRRRVAIAVTRTVMNVMGGTPTVDQKNLSKRFLLAPEGEVARYVLPVAAKLNINGVTDLTAATDAQVQTAVDQVLAVNVTLQIT